MREIYFRGKDRDNGEWITGDLMHPHIQTDSEWMIFPIDDLLNDAMAVDASTIGQYTGMNDKNDTPIFEGDILRVHSTVYGNTYHSKVYFRESAFRFMGTNENILRRIEHWDEGYASGDAPYVYEVIGNIHDNPELLEVKV